MGKTTRFPLGFEPPPKVIARRSEESPNRVNDQRYNALLVVKEVLDIESFHNGYAIVRPQAFVYDGQKMDMVIGYSLAAASCGDDYYAIPINSCESAEPQMIIQAAERYFQEDGYQRRFIRNSQDIHLVDIVLKNSSRPQGHIPVWYTTTIKNLREGGQEEQNAVQQLEGLVASQRREI